MALDEQLFLNDPGTLAALEALSGTGELVLYCGAGVSLDRTGRSWSKLINGVFDSASQKDRPGREVDRAAIKFLLDHLGEFDQYATLINEHFTDNDPAKVSSYIFPILQDLLYRNTWSEGYLLRNTVMLAIVASSFAKVTMLTTNYDVYLEKEFASVRESIVQESDSSGVTPKFPGLLKKVLVRAGDDFALESEALHEPLNSAAIIELVYLHGRVPGAGSAPEGELVLDELSYAHSRRGSMECLQEYFSRDDASVLILGASVTDKPLIQSLALTRSSNSKRFAIITNLPSVARFKPSPVAATTGSYQLTQADIQAAYSNRASHLGARFLYPMGFFQAAQFVEELQLAFRARNQNPPFDYADMKADVRYAARLERWASEREANGLDSTSAQKRLTECLDEIVKAANGKLARKRLRLEVWLRLNPRSNDRTLTLFSNSAGPLLDDDVRRKETISPESNNASVKAFVAGKPLLVDISELEMPSEASRWTSFLAVPVFVQMNHSHMGEDLAGTVPIGVVTLAGMKSANLADSFESLPEKGTTEIKGLMIATGRDIVRPV